MTETEKGGKMNKSPCVLCGIDGIRQPTIQTKIVMSLFVTVDKGGKKVLRNMFPVCKFHQKMFEKWFTDDERETARKAIVSYMKQVYPEWNMRQCLKEENDEN